MEIIYRENILKKHVLNDQRFLKMIQIFSGMSQHGQSSRAHMVTATTKLLEEYNICFIEWLSKGADLSPIELCFGEMQR
jgi:hypothetical protein